MENKKSTAGPQQTFKPLSPLVEPVGWVTGQSASLLKRLNITAKKVGEPPGTLMHVGEKKTERTTITILDYDEQRLDEQVAESAAA